MLANGKMVGLTVCNAWHLLLNIGFARWLEEQIRNE